MRGTFFLLIALAASSVTAQTSVLMETPVKISVDSRPEPETAPGQKVGAAISSTALNLALNQGSHEFRLTVRQRGNAAEALAAQRMRTGWKDGYLFIRDDCLGANQGKRELRCVVDQIFTFVEGRDGRRLVHLGEVFAGEDCIEDIKIGCALYRGTFTDIYDALENNALISRAESPALLLEMHAVGGELVVDLDDTWGRNQERYAAGERCLAAKPAERAEVCIDGITPRRAYIFNSVLATYTKRVDQLTRIRSFARTALCEGKSEWDCSEMLRLSAFMVSGIRPGEKPQSQRRVESIRVQLKD